MSPRIFRADGPRLDRVRIPPRLRPIDTAAARQLDIATVRTTLEKVEPGAFLRLHEGQARGFWARGDEWLAHAGSVAVVAADEPGSADRFSAMRDLARGLLGERDEVARLRWFGGFSFSDKHRAGAEWPGFPAARFILPRIEIQGSSGGPTELTLRGSVPADGATADVLEKLGSDLERLARRLAAAQAPPPSRVELLSGTETERRAWEGAVEKALEAIAEGRFSKTVLARTLDVALSGVLDPAAVAEALWHDNRGSQVFLFEPRPGEALVGAAPETLVALHGERFLATAVAGSCRRGDDDAESEALAARLLASEKDRAEQRIVVDDMVARLEECATSIEVQDEPHVLVLSRIQHLETRIRARVPAGAHVLDLVAALHPTPAVCGVPRDEASTFLEEEEPFERGWYAGPVGWFDLAGNGLFAPALRCGLTTGGGWRLFAGAGIVRGSDPSAEWEETRIKFEPMLRALAWVDGGEHPIGTVSSGDREGDVG